MASRWNLWVWLECIGVVSGCCCKEVHTFNFFIIIILLIPIYSTCISSFFVGSSIPTSLFILKMFFCSCFTSFLCNNYSKRCSKNSRNRSKIEITRTWRYNYIDKNVRRLRASTQVSPVWKVVTIDNKPALGWRQLRGIMARQKASSIVYYSYSVFIIYSYSKRSNVIINGASASNHTGAPTTHCAGDLQNYEL